MEELQKFEERDKGNKMFKNYNLLKNNCESYVVNARLKSPIQWSGFKSFQAYHAKRFPWFKKMVFDRKEDFYFEKFISKNLVQMK